MAVYKNLTAANIKSTANDIANDLERMMIKLEYWAESYNTIPGADLTAMGLDSDWQTQIGSMRSDIVALVAWYKANVQFVKRFAQLTII